MQFANSFSKLRLESIQSNRRTERVQAGNEPFSEHETFNLTLWLSRLNIFS